MLFVFIMLLVSTSTARAFDESKHEVGKKMGDCWWMAMGWLGRLGLHAHAAATTMHARQGQRRA